jgi:activator of HSP90 ATPase
VRFKTKFLYHNWAASRDWSPQDLAKMTPEQRKGYERRLLRERQKYIPIKSEDIPRLSNHIKHFEKLILACLQSHAPDLGATRA